MLRTHKNIFSTLKRKANSKKERKAYEILEQCLKNLGINPKDSIITKFKNKNGEGEISGFQIVLKGIDKTIDKARIEIYLYEIDYMYPYSQYPVRFIDEENSEIAIAVLSHKNILNDIKEIVTIKRQEMPFAKRFLGALSEAYISLKRNILERDTLRAERLRYEEAYNLIHKKCISILINKYTYIRTAERS